MPEENKPQRRPWPFMSPLGRSASQSFENFMDSFAQELIDTPDDHILDGEDPKELEAKRDRILDAAQREVDSRNKGD